MGTLLLLSLVACSGILSEDKTISRNILVIEELKISESFTNPYTIDGNSGWETVKSSGNCTGTGTADNPYIFENHDFLLDPNGGTCLTILNSDVHFIVRNCEFKHSSIHAGDDGIKFSNVKNGQIIDCDVSFNAFGIYLNESESSLISNCDVHNNTAIGIYLVRSPNNRIIGNNGYNNDYSALRYVWYCHNTTVSGNNFHDNGAYGFYFHASSRNIIVDNSFSYNKLSGLYIDSDYPTYISTYNIICKNTMVHNEENGLLIEDSESNSISMNTINNNDEIGVNIIGSDNNLVYENEINSNVDYGIYISTSYNNVIALNAIIGNGDNIDGSSDYEENNVIKENIYTSSATAGIPGYDLFVLLGGIFASISVIIVVVRKRALKVKF